MDISNKLLTENPDDVESAIRLSLSAGLLASVRKRESAYDAEYQLLKRAQERLADLLESGKCGDRKNHASDILATVEENLVKNASRR